MVKYRINLIDLIRAYSEANGDNYYLFYTGVSDFEIPVGAVFNGLHDSKFPENGISGQFKIEKIYVLSKESQYTALGYNAKILVSSNVNIDTMQERIKFDEKGNFKNVCTLVID